MTECDPITELKAGSSNFGLIIGAMIGCIISIVLIGLQHNALYHARLYVDVARVMATHDARKGIERLEDFERHFKADRFTETSSMLAIPAKLRICAAAVLEDEELLEQAVAHTNAQYKRWLQSDEGRPHLITSPSGLIYPFSMQSQWAIRVATVSEKWDEAIQLTDVGLKRAQEFWDDMGGTPENPEQIMDPHYKWTVAHLKSLERYHLTFRAWAHARVERYQLALIDIQTLLDEPLLWQLPDEYIVPEILLLRAAVEYRLDQAETAIQTCSRANSLRYEPVEFGPSKSPQVPHGWWNPANQFVSIEQSWLNFRARHFGIQKWWAKPPPESFSYTMTFRESSSDLVEEFVRVVQVHQLRAE